jgi:membrane protease YdiL (CAAX protease family)
MGYDVHITRKANWFDEEADAAITLQEWKEYVAADPEMRLDDYAEAPLPTGGFIWTVSEGLCVWTAYSGNGQNGNYAWFAWHEDRIVVKNPDSEILDKMKRIAEVLAARVQGDEGEYYDDEAGPHPVPDQRQTGEYYDDEVADAAAAPPVILPYPTIKESWGMLGWYLLVVLVVGTPCYLVLNKGFHLSQTTALLSIINVVNVALFGFLRWKAGTRWVKLQLTGHEQVWVYAVLPLLVVSLAVVLSLQRYLHLPSWNEKTFEKATQLPVVATVTIVLLGPVLEELLFRGVILQGLLRTKRPWVAIGQSALLFAIIHFNPAQSLNALFIGVLFGWLYYRTRSLWLCMASHCLFNSLAFGSRYLRPWLKSMHAGAHPSGNAWLYQAGFTLLGALVLAAILWRIRQTTAAYLSEASALVNSPALA